MAAAEDRLYQFNDGMPTKPDVDVLMRNWPDPKIGDRFEYEIIERLLTLKRETARFRTVTNRWRARLLDEKGIVVEVDTGAAFYCATADQVSARTYDVLRGFGRKARRHRKKLVIVKTETDEQRCIAEHQARLMLAVEHDAKKHRMNLLPATAIKPAPRMSPPPSAKEQGE